MVRFLACAGASSQARGNSQRAHPRRARRSPARGRVRALYAVAEVIWPCVWFKMSSRSLGGPTTGPSVRVAHSSVETESKRSAGKKEARRARGRKRAGLQIASAPRKGIQARLQRLVVGGGSCWHLRYGTRLKSFGSRKGTKSMEGVLVCLFAVALHGADAEADLAGETRSSRLPMRGLTANQCGD